METQKIQKSQKRTALVTITNDDLKSRSKVRKVEQGKPARSTAQPAAFIGGLLCELILPCQTDGSTEESLSFESLISVDYDSAEGSEAALKVRGTDAAQTEREANVRPTSAATCRRLQS